MSEDRNKVDGSVAAFLLKAVEHMAKLEVEMTNLRWRICHRPKPADAREVRAHARKLVEALAMVDHCLDDAREADKADKANKVVSLEDHKKPSAENADARPTTR